MVTCKRTANKIAKLPMDGTVASLAMQDIT
jgi:hypothetical protein